MNIHALSALLVEKNGKSGCKEIEEFFACSNGLDPTNALQILTVGIYSPVTETDMLITKS